MTKLLCFTAGLWMSTLTLYNCGSKPPCPLSDICLAVYACLMWFLWCSQDTNEVLMCFVASVIQFARDLYECFHLFFFVRERPVLSSCQLNANIFIIAGNSLWFPGILRKSGRANQKNILSLENKLKKHMMFRLFYLKGNSFLRRALESCRSIVTHAAQWNTDLYGTDSHEVDSCCGNLPGAPTIFLSWDT